ncbi:hypothetical protein F4780DRAFT_794669 [Xylariomycetidae sp. FL0641]|nr:hypothetical protein F4780DRAFT_794669 [Xylariomycetidae sp. FL0641]
MDETPEIQILNKADCTQQTLVPLPSALPLPPLAPSSIRIRTAVLGLTVNNLTYAKLGSLLGWWDAHPLPPSVPPAHADPAVHGRTGCWGYARVLASTCAAAPPPGSYLFGYLPLGTLPEDLVVEEAAATAVPGHLLVASPHRARLMPIYNRYVVAPPDTADAIAARAEPVAYDALLRVMHETAHLLAAYVFGPDPARSFWPGLGDEEAAAGAWSPAQADLAGATVLVFAPGAKAALAFAALLQTERPGPGERPARVVGVSSAASAAFVRGLGVYDAVRPATAGDPAGELGGGVDPARKVVVFDFGGRGGAAARWARALRDDAAGFADVQLVGVGVAEPPAGGWGGVDVLVNASDMRDRAMRAVGEARYFAGLEASWARMRERGVKGLEVRWGRGMREVVRGWERLAKGEVGPWEGLVFEV